MPDLLPGRWALVARDAFNGVVLWSKPLPIWQPYYVRDRNSYPADLHRRLVAVDGTVFVTLSIHGPVSALDAATGELLRTYAGTEKTEDIIYENGILYLSINTGDVEEIDRLQMAYRHTEPRKKRLIAIEAATGRKLWENAGQRYGRVDADDAGSQRRPALFPEFEERGVPGQVNRQRPLAVPETF